MSQNLSPAPVSGHDLDVARVVISLHVDSNDLAAWKQAAKAAGIELSEFIRRRVNEVTTTMRYRWLR